MRDVLNKERAAVCANMPLHTLQFFTALSEALNDQVRLVAAEKKELVGEAKKLILTIRQMEAAIEDPKPRSSYRSEDDNLEITYPLTDCIQNLKDKQKQVAKLHRERFEQVKSKLPCHHLSSREVAHS